MGLIVASVAGATRDLIHSKVTEIAREYRLPRYHRLEQGPFFIAMGWPAQFRNLKNAIVDAANEQGGDRSNISLVLVGHSAGSIIVFNTLRKYYNILNEFERIAVVLSDPHGSAWGDGEIGRRDSDDPLWWPDQWSRNCDFLRVYHIFQRKSPGLRRGLTGADFEPEDKAFLCQSKELTRNGVEHNNMPNQPETLDMIRSAFAFALGTASTELPNIAMCNVALGRTGDLLDGTKDVVFKVEQPDIHSCSCKDGRVQVYQGNLERTSFRNVIVGKELHFKPIHGHGERLRLELHWRNRVTERQFFLDFEPPTIRNFHAQRYRDSESDWLVYWNVTDEGDWNKADYQSEVTLDGVHRLSGSGLSMIVRNLSEGEHSVSVRVADGFGRWSDPVEETFNVSGRPSLSFVRVRPEPDPGPFWTISSGDNISITVEASHSSGIRDVKIFLDEVVDGDIESTSICYIQGVFGVDRPERRTCDSVLVESTEWIRWDTGPHKLIAVATDMQGGRTTIEHEFMVGIRGQLPMGLPARVVLDRSRIALGFLLGRPPSQGELSDFTVAGDVKPLPIEEVATTNLAQLPGIDHAQLTSFPATKSFFSALELSRVVPAGSDFLNQVIDFPRLVVTDRARDADLSFQPVIDTYVIEGAIESAVLETAGYRITAKGSGDSLLSVVGPTAEFTTLGQMPKLHLLKHATVDRPTLPAMRDMDGHLRYFVPNRIDVWFRRGMSQAQVLPILQAAGLRLIPGREVEHRVGLWRTEVIDRSGNTLRGMANALSILSSREEVLLAEPDELGEHDFTCRRITTMRINTGADFSSTSQNWNNMAIDLDAGHVFTHGSARVKIFVIDSGIDTDHPNIAPSLWGQWDANDLNFSIDDALDATSPEADALEATAPEWESDRVSHGTAVSSLATGQGISGPLGVAPDCTLVPIKIAGKPMSAGYGMRAAAIEHALDLIGPQERAVINLSWQTAGLHQGIRNAIERAETLNVPVVVAAGNYDTWQVPTANERNYPAAHAYIEPMLRNVVSVGAVNAELERASYSYFGDQSVTIAAPGGERGGIGNAVWVAMTEGGTGYLAGTSFAAPQVTGLLALILSRQPELSYTNAITILENTANAIDAAGSTLGRGLIQVGAALSTSGSGSSPVVSTPLNVNHASIDQLAALPPLCRWHAEGIVSYRESHGPYPSLWHLVLCGRVGFYLINKLEPLLIAF